jgi:hypothetical protein
MFPCQAFDWQASGGGKRIRTDDPLRARQVLSQLSYTPMMNLPLLLGTLHIQKLFDTACFTIHLATSPQTLFENSVVGYAGFEPATSCSQGRRATKLR